jgi:hypothetical protein
VALAQALPGSQVTSLYLHSNQITDAGAVALAEVLPGSQVTTLDLDYNQITDACLQQVEEAVAATAVGAGA